MDDIDLIFTAVVTLKTVFLMFFGLFLIYGVFRMAGSAWYRSYWEAYKQYSREVNDASKSKSVQSGS